MSVKVIDLNEEATKEEEPKEIDVLTHSKSTHTFASFIKSLTCSKEAALFFNHSE